MSGVHKKEGPKNPELKELLKELIVCQKDIDEINKMTSNEMLYVEEQFEKLREPLYKKRNTAIKRLPNFWGTTFKNNPNLVKLMGKEGLRSIRNLEVEILENIKLGYRIHFHFDENPYFENKVLTKEFRFKKFQNENRTTSRSTPIKWKEGKQDIATPSKYTKTMYKNFFDWFLDNDNTNFDIVGDMIRDDIWINPLRYYCLEEHTEKKNNEENKEFDDLQEDDEGDVKGNEKENDEKLNEQNYDNLNEEKQDNLSEEEENNSDEEEENNSDEEEENNSDEEEDNLNEEEEDNLKIG